MKKHYIKNIFHKIIFPQIIYLSIALCFILTGCTLSGGDEEAVTQPVATDAENAEDLSHIPDYNGSASIILNNNIPQFDAELYTTDSFEEYGELDELGRCTSCMACIGPDLMPQGERGDISHIKPTGWENAKYDFVEYENLNNGNILLHFSLREKMITSVTS